MPESPRNWQYDLPRLYRYLRGGTFAVAAVAVALLVWLALDVQGFFAWGMLPLVLILLGIVVVLALAGVAVELTIRRNERID